jgi:hypothetical protein
VKKKTFDRESIVVLTIINKNDNLNRISWEICWVQARVEMDMGKSKIIFENFFIKYVLNF